MNIQYYNFNNGRSAICMRWSPVNNAWIVAREDSGHQALLRIHNEKEDALYDYNERVSFVRQMELTS